MQSNEIIAIMRHRGWLKTEPRYTREQITSAVRYMMVKNGMSNHELAKKLTNPDLNHRISPSYIRRKVSEHRWRMDDLDVLPDIFHRHACDLIQGYRHMARLDDTTSSEKPAEESRDE